MARASAPVVGTVTLLHTNDTHSHLDPLPGNQGPLSGRGGIARRARIIKMVREHQPNTLVLDGGDSFQGTPYFNRYKGALEYELMSLAGYDVVAVGNHDLDAGVEGLGNAARHARFSLVASYKVTGTALEGLVQARVVRELGGVKVGLFGLGVVLEGLVNPRLCQGVSYVDPVEAARQEVEALRDQGCDLVVALSHLGYRGMSGEPGDLQWPQRVAGVDYVVGGHTHTFLERPEIVRGPGGWETSVMQVGFAGVALGRADIHLDGRRRVRIAAQSVDVDAATA